MTRFQRTRARTRRAAGTAAGSLLGFAASTTPAWAEDAAAIDSGDTTWLLVSSAIVLMMTAPGLALFYGGLVRRKNALATIMQCFILMAVMSIQWVLWGYTLAFGPDVGSVIGSLDWLGLVGVGGAPSDYAPTVPHQAFMIFQGMFAIITPALIAGAIADRMKFSAFLTFAVLWATLVYDPLAHWVWGGGWIGGMGALDFAGGTVVHISSGVSALVAAIVLGKRLGYPAEPMPPHNVPYTVIGAALLWFGWFGFNAGSALAADAVAVGAFVATNTAAAAATLGWMGAEWWTRGKPTVLGAATGAVAGLVGITPAAGFVSPLSAIVIGVAVGVVCFAACSVKFKFGYDDSLDVVGVHGVGGALGALLTGVLASTAVNPGGADGLLFGNPGQLWIQFVSVAVTAVYCGGMTYILLKIVDAVIGLRVTEDDEQVGLDLSQHGETAYTP